MNKSAGAIVIGGHFQGLGVVRALARHGVKVVVVDHQHCISRFSRYIYKFIFSPAVLKEDAFLDFMVDLHQIMQYDKWVLFPTDDETVFFLSKNKNLLERFYTVPTPEWDIVKFAYNKKFSYKLAESIDIPIPKTYYPNSLKECIDMELEYPLIIKPAVMRDFFRITKKKVFCANNKEELINMYQKATKIINPSEILIQERIPDVANNLYSFCPLFKGKKVLASIVAKRWRQHPMDFGQASTYAETVHIPELKEMGSRLLSAMDYYGLCEVEFIRDSRDGQYKFLEVNPRVWGWHTLALKAGVNLPYMLYQDISGNLVHNGFYRQGVKWFRLTTDIPTVLTEIWKKRMNIKDYLHSLKGEKEYAVFSMKDPLPFIGELFLIPFLWKKRGF